MQTIKELYKTVVIHSPNEAESKKINAIYEICGRVFETCKIDEKHKPVYHMLVWNLQRFARLHRLDFRVKLIEMLADLEQNLLITEKAITKHEIDGDRFLSYIGGLTQGICFTIRERKKNK